MLHDGRIIWEGPAGAIDSSGQSPTSTSSFTAVPRGRSSMAVRACTVPYGEGAPVTRVTSASPAALSIAEMGRQMRRLRRMEQHRRGGRRPRDRTGRHGRRRRIERPQTGAFVSLSGASGEPPRRRATGVAEFDRVLRRRPGAGQRRPDRRRSRYRQVDPVAGGRSRAGNGRRGGGLRFRRGGGRPDPDARGTASGSPARRSIWRPRRACATSSPAWTPPTVRTLS